MVKTRDIENRIAGLHDWMRVDLLAEWERLYCATAPVRISKQLLIRAIAYKWQEEVYGGLSKSDQKLLERLVEAFKKNPENLKPSLQIKAGTRMRRLWQGKMHEVTVANDGFVYEEAKYRSLSEIARLITGTKWNGLVFFGLKRKKKNNDNATA